MLLVATSQYEDTITSEHSIDDTSTVDTVNSSAHKDVVNCICQLNEENDLMIQVCINPYNKDYDQ